MMLYGLMLEHFILGVYLFLSVLAGSPVIMFTLGLMLVDGITKDWKIRNPPARLDSVVEGYSALTDRLAQELNESRRLVVHLSRKIRKQKKYIALAVVLGLFVISVVNPAPSLMPLAIGIEPNEMPFFTAADGDESSESLTVFSETLDEDVLFYPDRFFNDSGAVVASSGVWSGTATEGSSWVKTQSKDEDWWWVQTSGTCEMTLWFTHTHDEELDGFSYGFFLAAGGAITDTDLKAWDHIASAWDVIQSTPDESGVWWNGSVDAHEYWNTTTIGLRYCATVPAACGMLLDYAEISDFDYMTLADSDHYADGFCGVSDWAAGGYPMEGGDSFSSDDDLLSMECAYDAGNQIDSIITTGLSLSTSHYVEFRWRVNATKAGGGADRIYIRVQKDASNRYEYSHDPVDTDWHTYRCLIANIPSLTGTVDEVTSVQFMLYFDTDGDKVDFEVDYLRIGPADEMGWQHDGSTTAGVTDGGGGSSSSDGDELTLTADADGSTFEFAIDTTATAAYLDADYYPMIGLDFNDADSADYVKVESYDGSAWATVIANTTIGTDTLYANCRAADADIEKFRISVNPSANPRLDWFKAFGIANFSYSASGYVDTNNVCYVESDSLKFDSNHWISLNYDPSLSVDVSTYNVWNVTCDDADELIFKTYIGGWESRSGETRGTYASTGTLTGILIQFHDYASTTLTVSAVKFIEDGTAPDADIVVSPNPPDDDEQVTLSSIVFDDVEVWRVWYNAISYPTGFSDVDYSATEGQENYWSYSFSSLIAGDYCFKVIANDGANNNTITQSNRDYVTVRFTVREAAITITTYTFFGASSDFSYMQYSGHISHDCTYNISEWSTTWAKNETHTGSVTEGMFNIAWDKITVDDAEANFTIVFVSGSLSLTIEGYYGTAYKLLRITEIEVMNMEESLALTNITITFYTNKDVDWYVYDRDDGDAVLSSGSSVEGSDDLYFLKNRIPYAHYYAVKWDDGVTQIWYNSSYWTYRQNVDSINPPGTDWGAKDQRKTIEFWSTIGAFASIAGIIVLGLMYYGQGQRLKALQLPSYSTREDRRKER